MDPDRWAEEKRRGLTIDLGYAWCTLPSGREIGFVDVPGHERFVGNMLAGVGPVRLVLFVVAADEGWKPQSEEHLQILDVLGVAGGVIALTKRDLVDDETLAIATDEVLERVEGTVLAHAPVIPVSAETGEGVDRLVAALDTLLGSAPAPEPARTRLFVDRVFTIKGAGTVATGTLTGGCLSASQSVEAYPAGRRARVRGLQTHKHDESRVCPVTRVAANLTGAERDELVRGDVLADPGAWRPTTVFDVAIRPVRDLDRIPARGAFKVYAGAAEVDAKIRLLDEPFARVRTAHPLVLDVFDRFVVRESGRQRTVGGGTVLDVAPPRAADERHRSFLVRRAAAGREELPALLIEEARRGARRGRDAPHRRGAAGSSRRMVRRAGRPASGARRRPRGVERVPPGRTARGGRAARRRPAGRRRGGAPCRRAARRRPAGHPAGPPRLGRLDRPHVHDRAARHASGRARGARGRRPRAPRRHLGRARGSATDGQGAGPRRNPSRRDRRSVPRGSRRSHLPRPRRRAVPGGAGDRARPPALPRKASA